tara:strand:+ start:3593 stop:4744 length:1152 start_codon:yes stop_codon:yes gene_type:complete
MKKVAVFTGTRAEYGLLYWLLKDIENADDLTLHLLVSGSHLSPEFGHTIDQIKADGFEISETIEMLLSSDSAVGTVKSLGLGIIGYSDALERQKPDVLIVLGDRYEALGIAQAAMLMRIPILHIHGGEITEGAYDDAIRHAITKFSLLHATSTEPYRQRVIQLGEAPERVRNVGAIGLDHIKRSALMSREELSESLNFSLDSDFAVLTYHPVTLANEPAEETFLNITEALSAFPDLKIIVTYPNADDGGRKIIPLIESFGSKNSERVKIVPSLGQRRYLSAVKHSKLVIGNSSSGILEVPSFKVPTVNVGVRQQGRIAAESVLHCKPSADSIKRTLTEALKLTQEGRLDGIHNPYGFGNAGPEILKMIRSTELDVTKTFYNIT